MHEPATSAILGLNPLWLATVLFVATYAVIITEKINRAIVSLIGAGLMITLGVLNQEAAIRGIDFNTLGLLTGMMVIVAISRAAASTLALDSTAPFTPINRTLVPWIVCNRIRKAGLKVPVPGARAFRHRFATQMLADGQIESGVRRIGAEQELVLADRAWRPAPVAMEVLDRIDDPRFTTELGLFNLEMNLDPLIFGGDCLRRLEAQLNELVTHLRNEARAMEHNRALVDHEKRRPFTFF